MIKKIITMALLSMLLFSIAVVADQRMPPHQFYGDVTTNGVAAPDNLLIEARKGSTVLQTTTTDDGKYGYSPDIFYIVYSSAIGQEGTEINFYIKDKSDVFHEAGTAYFFSGEIEELDLSAEGDFGTASNDNNDDGGSSTSSSSSSGGSSGGGGGGAYIPPQTDEEETDDNNDAESTNESTQTVAELSDTTCTPDWYCSEWTECLGEKQTRTCVDDNDCDVEEGKPDETRNCTITRQEIVPQQEEQSFFNAITGFVTGDGNNASSWAIIPLGILGALLLFLGYRKRRSIKRLFRRH